VRGRLAVAGADDVNKLHGDLLHGGGGFLGLRGDGGIRINDANVGEDLLW
jgi:hypothetical protein